MNFLLRTRKDIERVKQKGKRYETRLFNLMSCRSTVLESRVGIIVGRRFGTAVSRNRIKRVFRELARHSRADLVSGRDLIIFPKGQSLSTPHRIIRHAWRNALEHEGLLNSSMGSTCERSASG